MDEAEKRISDLQDNTMQLKTSSKDYENFFKNIRVEQPGNVGHYEKINPLHHRDRGRRRIPREWYCLDLRQNNRRKFPQTERRQIHINTRST